MEELNAKQEDDVLEEAREVPEYEKKLEEMKAESDRMEKVLTELKEVKAIDALSGKIDAGHTEEKPVEETPAEYAKKALKGDLN